MSALEAKLACVTRAPVNEFPGYAKYGDELIGENAVYDEADSGNPDSLTDLRSTMGLDWDFGATPSFGFWVLTVQEHVEKNTSSCRSKWTLTPTPSWWEGGGRNEKSRPLSRQLRAALSGSRPQ